VFLRKCFKSSAGDSVVTAFVTLPSSGNTVWAPETHVIATCDKIFSWVVNENIIDLDNWRVVPPSLGTVVELQDHTALFIAGSTAGVGNILADGDNMVWARSVMVIANYQLNGWFLYDDRNLIEYLPVKRSLVKLHTPDPQSTDFVLTIDDQQIRFRFVTGRYTNENGCYEFDREGHLGSTAMYPRFGSVEMSVM